MFLHDKILKIMDPPQSSCMHVSLDLTSIVHELLPNLYFSYLNFRKTGPYLVEV